MRELFNLTCNHSSVHLLYNKKNRSCQWRLHQSQMPNLEQFTAQCNATLWLPLPTWDVTFKDSDSTWNNLLNTRVLKDHSSFRRFKLSLFVFGLNTLPDEISLGPIIIQQPYPSIYTMLWLTHTRFIGMFANSRNMCPGICL